MPGVGAPAKFDARRGSRGGAGRRRPDRRRRRAAGARHRVRRLYVRSTAPPRTRPGRATELGCDQAAMSPDAVATAEPAVRRARPESQPTDHRPARPDLRSRIAARAARRRRPSARRIGYTHSTSRKSIDMAPRFGARGPGRGALATRPLGAASTGVSHQRLRPGVRQGFGHRHRHAEEVAVVAGAGSGRVKIDDEVRELRPLDAVRFAPGSARAFEAGAEVSSSDLRPASDGDPILDPIPAQGRAHEHHAVSENLIQINRYRFVNAFLVREDDGFTLVDTTVGGGADELIAAAREAGGEIRRIALTHGHGDHVGSLDALKEKLGELRGGPDARARRPHPRRRAGRRRQAAGLVAQAQDHARRPADRRRADRQPRGRSPPRATPPATSRSWTRATARSSWATCSPRSAASRSRTTSTCAFRSRRWPPGTRARTSSRPSGCASSSPRCSSSATAARSAIPRTGHGQGDRAAPAAEQTPRRARHGLHVHQGPPRRPRGRGRGRGAARDPRGRQAADRHDAHPGQRRGARARLPLRRGADRHPARGRADRGLRGQHRRGRGAAGPRSRASAASTPPPRAGCAARARSKRSPCTAPRFPSGPAVARALLAAPARPPRAAGVRAHRRGARHRPVLRRAASCCWPARTSGATTRWTR